MRYKARKNDRDIFFLKTPNAPQITPMHPNNLNTLNKLPIWFTHFKKINIFLILTEFRLSMKIRDVEFKDLIWFISQNYIEVELWKATGILFQTEEKKI